MTQEKITLSVRPRGKPVKKLPEEVTVPSIGPAIALYDELAAKSGSSVHRLRVTKGSDGALVPNSKDTILDMTGLRHQSTIYVKDLGPQIPWRTVFLVEYAGPLLLHPLLYLLLTPSHSRDATTTQTLSLILITTHFLKRELETLFVHRFSAATMPAFNIFRNSAHYWLLSGVNMAYWIYSSPSSPAPYPFVSLNTNNDTVLSILTALGLALFTLGELANLSTHLTLRGLRPAGSAERGIPQGLGFEMVTCPNYMFEIVAWVGIVLVTRSWSTVLFAGVAVMFMGAWSKKKERRYRKEFGRKYRGKRFVMLPGIW